MLPPEPAVLAARMGFPDAQIALVGSPRRLGTFTVSWYGTEISDEIGSFAVVDPTGPLSLLVGDFLQISYQQRSVNVYVIGSYSTLLSDIAISRRSYLAINRLAQDPVLANVAVLS